MGSIEADDLQLGQNDENDLQPFFVLHKASSQRIERKSGGKARRQIDLLSSVHESLEKSDIGEADGLEKLRNDAFDCVWSKTESVIKDVLRNINLDVFNEIDIWVHESFDAITSCGKPEFAKVTSSFPIVTDATLKQLFCGLVLTRNMEVVDDLLTFADLGQHLRSHGCHVANHSSFDFSPKNGISGSIKSLLRKFLMVTLDVADISALASWYAEQDNYGNPVVVIIEDLERCCGTVLSGFILMLRVHGEPNGEILEQGLSQLKRSQKLWSSVLLSFKATICSTTKTKQRLKQSPSPKKRKNGVEPRAIDEASLQAVMELQITGLLRMPSKRQPDYVQRVAFGL
ncbi:Origin recognition complex subunit 3 [Heracleum sosnowskyi]|uniref:Origin recognition complex subunit 3 n=1 Tax=Heracleum sosnowskyi TaxID=360622 RepID=A0AAD8NBK0_9APIA|nr:Origin recognition complex subunit 3 [Heracleum sosnowskyi]